MEIAVFGFDPTVEALETSLREAAEQGFPSFWMPQIFGMDALTAIAVAAKDVNMQRLHQNELGVPSVRDSDRRVRSAG